MGHALQAGAFAKAENAARFSERLNTLGLQATWFRGADGLHRVRFGDFPSRKAALAKGEALRAEGILTEFMVVAPTFQAVPVNPAILTGLRGDLVRTAEGFLGLPYLWGGTSAEAGFDCSGLTQAVYQLNGLQLPRSSRAQAEVGVPVARDEIQPGDLLFFATTGGDRITHVALATGPDTFIHAPRSGRVIRADRLDNPVLGRQFVGARRMV